MEALVYEIPFRAPFTVIGDNHIVLSQQYDPDQFWLSFMQGAVIAHVQDFSHLNEATKTKPSHNETLTGYLLRQEIKQPILPLMQPMRLSNGQLKRYHQCTKNWDKDSEGNLLTITVDFNLAYSREEVVAWCDENLRGRYNLSGRVLTVSNTDDAVFCKLRFL